MFTGKQLITTIILSLTCFSPVSGFAADIEAGLQKSSVCVGCHSPKGKSSNAQRPNLAAQQAEYLAMQLQAFKAGNRKNPMMQTMAINLKDDDIENLAAYYAGLPSVRAGGEPSLAEEGQKKATICLGCHGANAEGNGQIPRLAGQHPEYLEKQLNYFKTGTRKSSQMEAIAANLSDVDIKELAAYFGTL